MKAAVLSIGDELLFGEITDTNAVHISRRLYEAGVTVVQRLTVGDDEEAITEGLESLAEAAEAVIVTGGLGPTGDDVTARAAATACGRPLVLNDEALEHLRNFAAGRDTRLFPLNEKQALLPAKSVVIPNPTGTACGFSFRHNGCHLFFLPGVPSEMYRMFDESVLPALTRGRTVETHLLTQTFTVFGISEAEVDPLVRGAARPNDGITVAFCVDFPVIRVLLRGSGTNLPLLQETLAEAAAEIRRSLGEWAVAEGEETLSEAVARLFRETGLTLSLAESCTGGMIASRITDIAGSSAYFLQGAVTYSNAAKTAMLAVPAELVEHQGAVSPEVAKSMARGSRAAAGSDIALAVTGVAGPGASEAKPAGTVYIALADGAGCTVKKYLFPGDRAQVRLLTTTTALDWLRRYLLKNGRRTKG